jgi:F0F1-type ATP synthase delta subunit
LGGARLVVGNKIWDGSVRKRLEDLKRKLLAARMA